MAVYEYIATDETGARFSGTYDDITSTAVLRKELGKMNYKLVKAKKKNSSRPQKLKVKPTEVVAFVYNFAGMCASGLSITRSLEVSEEQAANETFKYIIADIRQAIETGSSLKAAFEKYREVFSDFMIGMLEAGETGGKLAATLQMSAEYLEKRAELKAKIKAAFAYPVIIGTLSLAVVTCMIVFVIPVFSKLYSQLHIELPLPTQILLGTSAVLKDFWWAILLLVSAIVILLRKLKTHPEFKKKWDYIKLNVPVFKNLYRMVVVSQFIRTFAVLAATGVSLVRALQIASDVTNNYHILEISNHLQRAVETGNSFADALKEFDIFPPAIVQLAASGAEAGNMPDMLNKGVDFLDKDIDRTSKALLIKLEPAITLAIGLAVGAILISAYLPMFDYMAHLK